ncbi:MAG TPA: DUF2505 domain-containing protein [Nocardioides sp.]|nr:DUF2505 domain-containing protein [Nocardioides sp.]
MAKRITHQMTYEAPLSAVGAMLVDADFRREVCDELGVLRSEVTVEAGGTSTEVRIDQVQAAHGLPSFARKLVGDEIHIVQAESWHSADAADVTVTIPGKPGEMAGTATLAESDGVTTETVDLTVKVGIPLVGGRIEGLIADMLLRALETEERTGRRWLAR